MKWRQTDVCLIVVSICQKIQTIQTPACCLLEFSSISCICYSTLLFWPLIPLVFTEISQETAVNPVDIVSTLQSLQMLKYWKGKHLILKRQVGSYAIKFIQSKYKHKITQNTLMNTKKTEEAKISKLNEQFLWIKRGDGWLCSPRFLLKGLMNGSVGCHTSTSVFLSLIEKESPDTAVVWGHMNSLIRAAVTFLHLSFLGKSVSLSSAKQNRTRRCYIS